MAARGINKFIGIGYLGADPDTRYLPSGGGVTSFNLGMTDAWKDSNGALKEQTEWLRCECWGRQAEVAAQYLHKGSHVYVEGKIQTDKWEKDGQVRYSTKLRVRDFQMLDGPGNRTSPARAQRDEVVIGGDDGKPFDDDIPF